MKKISPAILEEHAREAAPTPPLAPREPLEHILHGDRRVDHYDWLRHKGSPEVLAYLEAENAYSDIVLQPTLDFQESSIKSCSGASSRPTFPSPIVCADTFTSSKRVEGKQYPYHYRRRDPLAQGGVREVLPLPPAGASPEPTELVPEELLLDLNQLAEGHSFLGLGAFEIQR